MDRDTGPYRRSNHSTSTQSTPTVDETFLSSKKMVTPWRFPLSRMLFGRPFRTMYLDETRNEYWLAWFAHVYEQRYRHVAAIGIILVTAVISYIIYCINSGTAAGLELAAATHTVGRETLRAKSLLNNSDYFYIYSLPCRGNSTLKKLPDFSLLTMRTKPHDELNRDLFGFSIAAERLLQTNDFSRLPCVCAPLVGYQLRTVAYVDESENSTKILCMPRLRSTGGKMIVRHSQAAHFDIPNTMTPTINGTSDVFIVRSDPLVVHAANSTHDDVEVELSGHLAYCVEECIDTLDGVSIWARALSQLRAGIDVNTRWHAIEQFDC